MMAERQRESRRMPSTPTYHGWGLGSTTLSVAPSPSNARAIALILTTEDEGGNPDHRILADFFSEYDAADCMDFLDKAFKSTAEANAVLAQRVVELGG